ncbi:MAG: CopG family transcriptional regulator [Sandaracinaceae bacterium]|nr:CopG family transcriptional regulator [Sandaracinaceae bacterium]
MTSRVTISLPEELAATVSREAKRRGEPVSALVREAIERYLRADEAPRVLPFVGLGRSGKKTTARDAEKILAREWSRDRDR